MAAPVVNSVQKGSASFTTSDTSINVTITSIDTSKSILFFSSRTNSADPKSFEIRGRIAGATTLTFDKETAAVATTVEWQVIEFSAGVSVEHLYGTSNTTDQTVTISAVTLSKAFPLVCNLNGGTQQGSDDYQVAKITGTTTMHVLRTTASATLAYAYQIIQFDEAVLIRKSGVSDYFIEGTTDTSVQNNITLEASVDLTKTFPVMSQMGESGLNLTGEGLLTYFLQDATTLRMERYSSGTNQNAPYIAYVVYLPNNLKVQKLERGIADTASTDDGTITVVDTTKSVVFNHGCNNMGRADVSDDNAGSFAIASNISSSTNVRTTRSGTTGDALSVYSVLEFSAPVTASSGLMSFISAMA